MIVIPAIDIKKGKCVRLKQGRKREEIIFSNDPAAVAKKWEDAGAEMIHVIDLDGAFEKRPVNISSIKKILKAVHIPVQLGGGIRDAKTIRTFFDLGIQRIILGTEAIDHPKQVRATIREYPGRVVIGIDARNGYVAVDGWTKTTRIRAINLARQFEDVEIAAINFTDIDRDGMQAGPNVDEIRRFAMAVSTPVVAAGGVSSIADLKHLMALESIGVVGVITGKAIYSGTLNLKEAIAFAKKNTHPSNPNGSVARF